MIVDSLVNQGISVYQEEGLTGLSREVVRKLWRDIYSTSMSMRGGYSLTLDNRTLSFSAPTSTVVKRNHRRFKAEKHELSDFIDEIRADDIVYDIGANTGLYSLFGATVCVEGKVVAFEPYPPNFKLLEKDVERNGFQNVNVIKVALSDSVGSVAFSHPDADDVGYGSSAIGTGKSEGSTEVPTTTGDRLIADDDIPEPNVVKIDVEGAEPLVLNGLERALSRPECRVIYCEVHLPGVDHRTSVEDYGKSPQYVPKTLEEFGFSVTELQTHSENEVTYKATK